MNKVFYELKFSGKLPSPAGVGMQILQLTQQEDCGLDEITKVVRSAPFKVPHEPAKAAK